MSLRFFHIFFILASSALAMLGAVWMLAQQKPLVWPVVWFSLSAGLDIYLIWFIRKSKGLSKP